MHLIRPACLLLPLGPVLAQLAPSRDQAVLDSDLHGDDLDFADSTYYYGISTFAHTKYVNCFSDEDAADTRYDIAIIGAPHDTVRALFLPPSNP